VISLSFGLDCSRWGKDWRREASPVLGLIFRTAKYRHEI
jgi:hypothetical protein